MVVCARLYNCSEITLTLSQLPIDARHVRLQRDRRLHEDARFLFDEVAQRLLERLEPINMQVQQALDAGCGPGWNLQLLRRWQPACSWFGLDSSRALLAKAQAAHPLATQGWLQRWIGGVSSRGVAQPQWLEATLAQSGLPAESMDLVWSNLVLALEPAPHRVFAEWWRILRPDALLAFSSLGPGSLPELRLALADAQLPTRGMPWVDMHDLGDLLVENGFADPVMDQEVLTLTYPSVDALLLDLRQLGGNACSERVGHLVGRGFRQRLLNALQERSQQADGRYRLSLEVVYGHAWRGRQRRELGETRIPLSSLRRGAKS